MKLFFHPGTNMAQAMAETVAYVNRSRSFMPPNTVPPFIMRFDAGSVPVGYLVFSSETRSIGEIQDYALFRVRPMFASLPGVSAPPPVGGNQRTIVVSVDPERLRAYATIRAPQTDPQALYVVSRRWVDRGAYLQPGTGSQRDALLSLVRVDRVLVVCDVPELDAVHVEPGDRVLFQASALPGRTFEGRVSRHAAALDPHTRTLRVEIDFDNPDGKPLYTGMYGTVTLVLDEARDIWVVPAASVHRDNDAAFVWVLAGDRVEQQPVKIGHTHAGLTEVLSGLTPRAQVVARAAGKLHPGQVVSASAAKGS
jgi:hypothetical protein